MAQQTARYSPSQGGAMVLGTILMGLDSYGAYESTHKAELGISYLTLAAPCIGIAACVLPILIARAWGVGHHLKAAVFFVALAAAGSVVVMAALERTGTAQDRTVTARQSTNQRVSLARAGIATAETALAEARARVVAECTSGRGRRCRAAEQQAEAALQGVSAARAALVQAGVVVAEDPRAKTLATLLPFLSERTIELYAPAVLPLSMLVVGFALLLYGVPHHAPERDNDNISIREPKTAPQKSRKRSRRKARPSSTKALASNVVPFRAANEN